MRAAGIKGASLSTGGRAWAGQAGAAEARIMQARMHARAVRSILKGTNNTGADLGTEIGDLNTFLK
ncbi:MAG: hypothetical protein JST01_13305 [Cyanobacteria bacterium SZAS TMP-1]|nr:hypothetical protein [Cyanobacteria bacterium SZAS TMP-1]